MAIDDVVDVMEEEATEDIYRLAQVSEDAEIFSPLRHCHPKPVCRGYISTWDCLVSLRWSSPTSRDTIAALAVLAVFMPIVAGQGGNAGNQTMTIVVRSLALGEISLATHGEYCAMNCRLACSTASVLGSIHRTHCLDMAGKP